MRLCKFKYGSFPVNTRPTLEGRFLNQSSVSESSCNARFYTNNTSTRNENYQPNIPCKVNCLPLLQVQLAVIAQLNFADVSNGFVPAATMESKYFSLEVELKSKPKWSIRLGQHEWAKHTYERIAGDPLRLLGSARHESQNGALAKLGEEFVLVVGDHITFLSRADNKILNARVAKCKPVVELPVYQEAPVRTVPAPVIIIKKRRVAVFG